MENLNHKIITIRNQQYFVYKQCLVENDIYIVTLKIDDSSVDFASVNVFLLVDTRKKGYVKDVYDKKIINIIAENM